MAMRKLSDFKDIDRRFIGISRIAGIKDEVSID
jgi:hypothetical protein